VRGERGMRGERGGVEARGSFCIDVLLTSISSLN